MCVCDTFNDLQRQRDIRMQCAVCNSEPTHGDGMNERNDGKSVDQEETIQRRKTSWRRTERTEDKRQWQRWQLVGDGERERETRRVFILWQCVVGPHNAPALKLFRDDSFSFSSLTRSTLFHFDFHCRAWPTSATFYFMYNFQYQFEIECNRMYRYVGHVNAYARRIVVNRVWRNILCDLDDNARLLPLDVLSECFEIIYAKKKKSQLLLSLTQCIKCRAHVHISFSHSWVAF